MPEDRAHRGADAEGRPMTAPEPIAVAALLLGLLLVFMAWAWRTR